MDNSTSNKKKTENTTKDEIKEDKKPKKKPTQSAKKSESKIVAKSLTMTKIEKSEKPTSGSQKKGVKRKADDNKESSKKPGRPRLNSNATDSGKGNRRNSTYSDKKTSGELHNGKAVRDESTEKYKGTSIALP